MTLMQHMDSSSDDSRPKELHRYLVVQPRDDGISGILNVGVFDTEFALEAKVQARKQWKLEDSPTLLIVRRIDYLNDGWSFFV